MTDDVSPGRSPGRKLLFAILVGVLLSIPLFTVWLLIYDRQSQSETARASITEGWGGPQTFAGPMLVIPFQDTTTETVTEAGREVAKSRTVWRELFVAPTTVTLDSTVNPQRRQRSIYDAVVYDTVVKGEASFALPVDLPRYGVTLDRLVFDRAEIRFGLSDARGVAANNKVSVNGTPVVLQPGNGLAVTNRSGFFAWFDGAALRQGPVKANFSFGFRGNANITMAPKAGETIWTVRSSWPSPSFTGGFLPSQRTVSDKGFTATYRISNLALGVSLVSTEDAARTSDGQNFIGNRIVVTPAGDFQARVDLVQPVDLYDQVSRAAKYGFLFIGFTFLAFLMFDVIGGVAVSTVEYLLVGAALVLFFVLLLAFAEVIGFTAAYLVASGAIIGLITAYSAAVLRSWRRAAYVGGLLTALYAVLYVLLSLEAYSLLIGALMLFVALAFVMYVTRRLDWSGRRTTALTPSEV
jgi:inner membrane protein